LLQHRKSDIYRLDLRCFSVIDQFVIVTYN